MQSCSRIYFLLILSLLTTYEINSSDQRFSPSKNYEILQKWTNLRSNLRNTSTVYPATVRQKSMALKVRRFPNDIELADNGTAFLPNKPVPMLKPNPFSNGNLKKTDVQKEGTFCRRRFDGRSGYCILAYQCLHVIREYRVHGTKIDICTYRNNLPVVCCPLAEKHSHNLRISAQKCIQYNEAMRSVKSEVAGNFSGRACISSVPMIVGGEKTQTGEYPHMAALGWTEPEDVKWGCGGILISEQFVLTAAHCTTFGDKPPDIVRLGTNILNNGYSEDGQDIKILLIILHPKYQTSQYYNDVAVLKLSKKAKLSARVRPVCLWHLPDLKVNSLTALGWGRTEFLGDGTDLLQKVDLNLISQRKCRKIYKKERRLPFGIMDSQFCAGLLEGGKDTCQGDSGGPLLVQLPEYNCVQFVVGITSFGKFCAVANAPGVYTKISTYLDWIENVVFQP